MFIVNAFLKKSTVSFSAMALRQKYQKILMQFNTKKLKAKQTQEEKLDGRKVESWK